jgi:multimeric flavodoxin WrbA
MAQAVRWGFQNTTGGCAKSGIKVDIYDLAENTTGTEAGCPTWDDVKDYDLFIFGAPAWNGLPPSDIISYMNLFPLKETDMRCKPAAGFATAGGYQAGGQMVVESLKRIAMTFQMFWIGGPQWNIGMGSVANTGTWPFYGSTERSDGVWDLSVSPLFLNDAWGLGSRLANLTMDGGMKSLTSMCGDFAGLDEAERR